ncbi:MAG: lipoyl(octanoyl) transferase LipB [Armatimonadota bacterium]
MSAPCRLFRPGLVPYGEALRLQEEVLQAVADGAAPEALILLEHPPVYTVGRSSASEKHLLVPEHSLSTHAEVYRVGRGGDVTFHGPGQLVGYPVMDLRLRGRDVHRYVRQLEEVLIATLADFGVRAQRRPGMTGVWVAGEKIASIGVQVRRGVTMHGFALNVSTDLSYFSLIIPCGIRGCRVTSLSRILSRPVDLDDVADRLLPHFARVFEVAFVEQGKQVGCSQCV